MKRKFKIILDIIMLLMMITFFNKSLISMQYHEIAGLVLIGLVTLHIAINIKMITAMGKNFLKIPAAIKVCAAVDILLLICFLGSGISGVLISRTILTSISSGNMIFKMGHMFTGGLSVILLGIHIGLHICRKPLPIAAAVIISAVVLCGGIYGAVNSSEVRWLTMPFTVMTQTNANSPDGTGNHIGENGTKPPQGENTADFKEQERTQNKNSSGAPQGKGKNMPSMTLAKKLESVLMFLNMILLCVMITYWIALPKKKKTQCKENANITE